MYKLKLQHHFCGAHQLTHAYSKECNDNLHGHNWKVFVEIEKRELDNGMVIDFKKLKEIIDKLDHKNLNTILDFEPTAENIAHYLHDQIKKEVKDGYVKITLWESEDASITYYINEYDIDL